MRLILFIRLSILAKGFTTPLPSRRLGSFTPSIHRVIALHENRNDADPSMVAAASASSLCSISGDDPVLKSWCEEAMMSEIPQLFEGESEIDTCEDYGFYDEEELVWKVPYTEDMVSLVEIADDKHHADEDLCVIDEAFDIGNEDSSAADASEKRIFRPKKRKHLFRYSPDISVSCWLSTVKPKDLLLSVGYSEDDISRMKIEYPKLLTSNPKDIIAPKLRFLVNVLGGGTGDIGNGVTLDEQTEENFIPHNLQVSEYCRRCVSTHAFFSPRLEILAPRHAYLAFHGDSLPFGNELLQLQSNGSSGPLLNEFLDVCTKSPSDFADLCQRWETDNIANREKNGSTKMHTAESVKAMDNIFADGIATFARYQRTNDLQMLGKYCTPAEIFALLLSHGSNYAEHDDWGSTILHWTAGTNNLEAMKVLIDKLEQDEEAFGGDKRDVLWSTCASCSITRDGATPLHWASCGVSSTQFGCGGNPDVCSYLLNKAGEKKQSLAAATTSAGNTPLMWACWAGSVDVAKLLISAGADPFFCNDNGMNAAHWAASSGNVEMCEYLYNECGLAFQGPETKDNKGKSPLDISLSFGRANVVEWIARLTHELTQDAVLSNEQVIEKATN